MALTRRMRCPPVWLSDRFMPMTVAHDTFECQGPSRNCHGVGHGCPTPEDVPDRRREDSVGRREKHGATRTHTDRSSRGEAPSERRAQSRRQLVSVLGDSPDDTSYWDAFYAPDPDPFGFDSNPDEGTKFARTLSVCGIGRLGRVLELGCSIGTFTDLLAPLCDEVLAVDISPTAIGRATERLAHHDNVTCEVLALPTDLPGGPFDLIVASDVLYYWPMRDLLRPSPGWRRRWPAAVRSWPSTTCRRQFSLLV